MDLSYEFKETNYLKKFMITKLTSRFQEAMRFEMPHKSFTYLLHGYQSVVGPVKGVYSKESSMNKAREHALLIKDRPAYVTILTLGK